MNTEEKIVWDFIKLFSSMEYNLKKNWYRKCRRYSNDIEPDWKNFETKNETAIKQIISSSEENLKIAIDYIFSEPPRIQKYVNWEIDWEDQRSYRGKNCTLIDYIKRIRNNLFHWWKCTEDYFSIINYENKRNLKLIESATTILKRLSEIDTKINSYYN